MRRGHRHSMETLDTLLGVPFLSFLREERLKKLAANRAADPKLSTGPDSRFVGRIEFDGQVHYYDTRTQVCERRRGTRNIPKGSRRGWIVSKPFNGNGRTGMYARYDAYVIRPKTRAELEADRQAREARKAKLLARRAIPFTVRLLLAHSGYNRKGVLRTQPEWAEKLVPGFVYPREHTSPYGPRTRNLLTRLGVPVEKHNEVLTVFGFTV